jgi:NAD(P)H-dependent FMN reductase
MKTVIAFGASNASDSINAQLARYASSQLTGVSVTFLDLNDFEMPIYSSDRQRQDGVPEPARRFQALIREASGVLISFAEHNGSYTVAFKNLFDWTSVLEGGVWLDTPLCLMATSPGPRGGLGVLSAAVDRMPRNGGVVVSSFSLPSFAKNFNEAQGVTDPALSAQLQEALRLFQGELNK